MLLDIIDEMHLLQPSTNLQLSRKTPDALLKHTLRVVGKGYGFPSIFNADAVVQEQLRQGKTLEDARAGGCSGCVEVGAFGKEAYILTGYFNLVKVLELALHNGIDPRTGRRFGSATGDADGFGSFETVFAAFRRQLQHFLEIKLRGNQLIEQMYATMMPAPFLSVITDDCIRRVRTTTPVARATTTRYIQYVGIGSLTDSLSAIKQLVFDEGSMSLSQLVNSLDADFEGREVLRLRLLNRTHKYGNDDDYADQIMLRAFAALFEETDGRSNSKGGKYRVEMLPTTCHVYFGSVTGAMPDGARRGCLSPKESRPCRGRTVVVRRRSSSQPPKWTTSRPAAPF